MEINVLEICNTKLNKPLKRATCQRGTSASTSFAPLRHSRLNLLLHGADFSNS